MTPARACAQLATAFEIVGSNFVQGAAFRLLEGLAHVALDPGRDLQTVAGEGAPTELVYEWLVAGRPQRLLRLQLRDGGTGYLLGSGAALVAFYAHPQAVARAWAARGARVRRAFAQDGERVAQARGRRRA